MDGDLPRHTLLYTASIKRPLSFMSARVFISDTSSWVPTVSDIPPILLVRTILGSLAIENEISAKKEVFPSAALPSPRGRSTAAGYETGSYRVVG